MKRDNYDDGPYGALKDLFEYNYLKEDYVMTLSDIAVLHQHWDSELISFYETKPISNICLVVTPIQALSFTVFHSFNSQGMPIISLKKAPESKKDTILPAKFWVRECTFAPSRFWKDIFKNSPVIKHLHEGTNFIVTCLGYKNNWRFVHPNNLRIYERATVKQNSAWDFKISDKINAFISLANQSAIKVFSCVTLKPVLKMLNIENGIVHSNAFLGIVDEHNNEELVHKFGSRADYFYWKSKFGNK